jgi:hypothetical protein
MRPFFHQTSLAALIAVLLLLPACDSSKQAAKPPTRLGADVKKAVQENLASITSPVTVRLYRGGEGEVQGEEAQLLMDLMSRTSTSITVESGEMNDNTKAELEVDHGPVIEYSGPTGGVMRYYGFPERKEVGPFVDSVILASGGLPSGGAINLSPEMSNFLSQLEQEVVIRIFTTPD